MARPTRTASLTLALLLLPLAPAAAQGTSTLVAPRWRLELGAALPGAKYASDGEGGGVTAGVAPFVGATAVWRGGYRGTAELGFRASRAPVSVETSGVERDADPALQLDVVAAVGVLATERLTLRAGGGLSMLRGDDATVPFSSGNDAPWHLAGEAGMLVRLSSRRPLGLAVTGHFMRLGGDTVGDPVEEGTLTRVLVGVTYGR